jgi:alpha-D-xyloside xylohydrolase
MMSGIPWWTTDVGGFSGGDATSADYRELITRWYQYGALCPIFRTHGDRERPKITPLPAKGPRYGEDGAYCTAPGGHVAGGPNEFWAFGNETATRLVAMIRLRYTLILYIERLAQNVSSHGAPPQRPLFYDFPAEPAAWAVDDQFMFGPEYLVAPVLEAGAQSRNVYFPGGPGVRWRHYFSGVVYAGGSNVSVPAPLDEFPLFNRMA